MSLRQDENDTGPTVSELAAKVARATLIAEIAPPTDLVLRRLRHWTNAGLLPLVVGDQHTGTGRHRRYRSEAVHIAAVLNALADLALPLGVLKAVAGEIRRIAAGKPSAAMKLPPNKGEFSNFARSVLQGTSAAERRLEAAGEAALWRSAIDGTARAYLNVIISYSDGEDYRVLVTLNQSGAAADIPAAAVVLPVTALFARIGA